MNVDGLVDMLDTDMWDMDRQKGVRGRRRQRYRERKKKDERLGEEEEASGLSKTVLQNPADPADGDEGLSVAAARSRSS